MLEEGDKALQKKAIAGVHELTDELNSPDIDVAKVTKMLKGIQNIANEYCQFHKYVEDEKLKRTTEFTNTTGCVRETNQRAVKDYIRVKVEKEKATVSMDSPMQNNNKNHDTQKELITFVLHVAFVILLFLCFYLQQTIHSIIF